MLETLMSKLEEKEQALKEMLSHFNRELGKIQGEISMIHEMIELLEEEPEKEKALPSEVESEA